MTTDRRTFLGYLAGLLTTMVSSPVTKPAFAKLRPGVFVNEIDESLHISAPGTLNISARRIAITQIAKRSAAEFNDLVRAHDKSDPLIFERPLLTAEPVQRLPSPACRVLDRWRLVRTCRPGRVELI